MKDESKKMQLIITHEMHARIKKVSEEDFMGIAEWCKWVIEEKLKEYED